MNSVKEWKISVVDEAIKRCDTNSNGYGENRQCKCKVGWGWEYLKRLDEFSKIFD
jgi:hypothetical protein